MNTHEISETEAAQVRKKTLIVLGLTFIIPIMATLIAIYALL
ncbi:hypothetical protein [Bdellovibrio bacteriovorus]|nr:hypothetical protein [Bdellovibrio bacteriovorus]